MPSTQRSGHEPSLARGAVAITAATVASRITGFVRVVVVAAVMGTTFLANTYQTANTAPNVLFELVAAGVLTSVFVPTFVDYLVKGEREQGWEVASILTSVALVALTGLAVILALAAPLVMRVLTLRVSDPSLRAQEIALGAGFLRLFAPQIVFYGAGMIMTAALHAHRRFGLAAAAPIFNNVVVIGAYLAYAVMRAGRPPSVTTITGGEIVVLGAGTTLGVVAMTFCLVPQLKDLGWRYRWSFHPSHPAVRKAARLGVWALGYAGGYQASLIVVLLLANRVRGGVAAYQWAYTFFYVPHAVLGVAIFNVLFPAMAEHASMRDREGFAARLQDGSDMLAFMLLPVSLFVLVGAGLISQVTLQFGVMSGGGVALVGRVLAAFAIGLPAYSAFLVYTRAFYALGDTKTPALVNAATVAIAGVLGAILFAMADDRWAVPGLALGHSAGFTIGLAFMTRSFARRSPAGAGVRLTRSLRRSVMGAALAGAIMAATRTLLPAGSRLEALTSLSIVALAGALTYWLLMRAFGSPELQRVSALIGKERS